MKIDQDKVNLIKLWDAALRGARKYVEDSGYVNVTTIPLIAGISGSCENVHTLFQLKDSEKFFGQPSYLLQSGQLLLELVSAKLEKTYAHVTSFRAETEVNSRHLVSFELFEIELQTDYEGLVREISNIVQAMATAMFELCSKELRYFGKDPQELLDLKFNRLSYTDAIKFLQENGFPELKWGDDLKLDHELVIGEKFGITFLERFPLDIKFFNMLQDPENPLQVLSCDLIMPGVGESAGCAAREHVYENIVKRLKSSKMYEHLIALGSSDEDFEWFLDAYKNAEVPPHAGAGIGVNRIMTSLLFPHTNGDIRLGTPFPVNSETLF